MRVNDIEIRRFTCCLFALALWYLGLLAAGCRNRVKEPVERDPAKVPVIAVTNDFLKFVAEELSGPDARVVFPMQGAGDPADWEPTLEGLSEFQSADLVLMNGATYEKWVAGVALPASRILRTANVFRGQWIEVEGVVHSHGPGGAHSHAGTAYTTWIDLQQARQQAAEANVAIGKLLGDPVAVAARFKKLDDVLQTLDAEMQTAAKRLGQTPLVVSHPVYQYWARRYNLNVKSIHWEPEVVPGAAEIEDLQKLLAEHHAPCLIWEAQPSEQNSAIATQMGLANIVFAPGGQTTAGLTWIDRMRANIRNLEAIPIPLNQ